jgi:hypothetical protein
MPPSKEVAPYLPEEAQQVLFWVAAGRSLDEALRETLGTLNAGAARPVVVSLYGEGLATEAHYRLSIFRNWGH